MSKIDDGGLTLQDRHPDAFQRIATLDQEIYDRLHERDRIIRMIARLESYRVGDQIFVPVERAKGG